MTLNPHPLLVPLLRKGRAIPLFPLWTVRPVQCLSACTTVHFTFTYTSTPPMDRTACTEPQCLYNGALYLYLYLYSPYGPYSLYRASVSVQRCTLPLPIPLLPLWTLQPVQSLSACTTVHFTYTVTYINIQVFLDAILCVWATSNNRSVTKPSNPRSLECLNLKSKQIRISETSVRIGPKIQRHIPPPK